MQMGLRQKLESCKTLPSLPAVAVHVLRLCQRENFDIADVARAIGSDAALAARVVALVNSPLFALKREVTTVSHALVLLGANAVRTIALSFAVVGDLRVHERPGFDHRSFWRRAIFAAIAAQHLARLENQRHPEDAFLSGLLQDLGALALQQAVPEQYQPMTGEAGFDHDRLVALEKQSFGCDHAEIGRWLVTQWRLPDPIRAAIGSSHEPARWKTGADPITESTIKIVALAGVLADLWVMPDTRRAARLALEQAQQILGLDEARLRALLRGVNRTVIEVAPLFGVQVGTLDEVERVIDRVEEILAQPDRELNNLLSLAPGGNAKGADGAAPAAPRIDPLTGLASRARFDAYLAEQFEFAARVGKPLSIILCDPDHFDMINQSFGREAGDRALRAAGALLGERLRHRDLAARWGGEEFALLLTDTHAAGAAVVAERLRKKIEDTQHDIGIGDPVRMTISVGCATLDEALTFTRPEDLMLAVERALLQAKGSGRNRVATFSDVSVAA